MEQRHKGDNTSSLRVVGWTAGLFIFSALFVIWAYDERHQSWLQKLQSPAASFSAPQSNVSMNVTQEAISWEKPGMHAGVQYAAENASIGDLITVLQKDVNGSNPLYNNTSASEEAKGSSPKRVGQCNLFRGRWVYDESYVLYEVGSCPFASNDFNCRKNGRLDSDFERWRWQPQDCDIPRFNASHILEKLRGKILVYVGDSINRNQWESMLCLLRAAVPYDRGNMMAKDSGKYIQYHIKAYNCSIDLSWAPFLVRQQKRQSGKEALGLDIIAQQSQHWKNADILIFNTGHWWTHEEPYRGVDYFEERGRIIPYMEELTAFEKALRTWSKWIDTNISPQKTQVFFRGYSPVHFHGKAWGKKVGGGCFNETEPIKKNIKQDKERIYGERKRMEIVEKVVAESKIGVKLLNVTGLSLYRKDAHTSVYTSKYTMMTNKNDYSYADCSHWCLPGLPDVWNNILYALLI